MAVRIPRMNPFVLNSRVGIQGKRTRNNAPAASHAEITHNRLIHPPTKKRTPAMMIIGRKELTSSTGIKVNRSMRLNLAIRISGVAR